MYYIIILIVIVFNITISSQIFLTPSGIPRDTSFTVNSSYEKEKKLFPFIEIADADSIINTDIDSNIVYDIIGRRELHLDLYSPKIITANIPLVLLIHGGGWRSGDRHQMDAIAKVLASEGYVAALIEYRLSPEAKYPAAIYDIKTAIRFLKKSCVRYSIDTNKVAIAGCSSGGHLASFVGATNHVIRFDGEKYSENSSLVHAIVNIDGILDFTHPGESAKDTNANNPSVGKLWLGSSYKDNQDVWIEASPLTYFSDKTPPILFVNSGIERFHSGRDSAIAILNRNNIYSEINTINKCPHTFWLFHPWFKVTCGYFISFLQRIFDK